MTWDLKKEPTKRLLKWLHKARACGYGYDPSQSGNSEISIEELKAELSTREHVPNKKEAKIIRQQKAKGI